MLQAFINTLKVKDLRNRLMFTALIIVIVRFASSIPCPGVDPAALESFMAELSASSKDGGGVLAFIDLFSGGALTHFALGALGIMPYITASIIVQLLVPVIPTLEKMQREGENGRQKLSQYTRYLTLIVCVVQGMMVALAMINPAKIGLPQPNQPLFLGNEQVFILMTILVLTTTTMVFTWLGEQITERGIGNGVSLIITIGIVSRLPQSVIELVQMAWNGQTPDGTSFKPVQLLLLLVVFCVVTAATIMLSPGSDPDDPQDGRQADDRRRDLHAAQGQLCERHADHFRRRDSDAAGVYVPLFCEPAGREHDLEFAGAVVPERRNRLYDRLCTADSRLQLLLGGEPVQPDSDRGQPQERGRVHPGHQPRAADRGFSGYGDDAGYGGMALALFPMFLYSSFKIPFMVAQFFGGTSLLIMVGVVLDTMSQLESHLTMRHYEGFLKSGRLRSRSGN